MIFHDETTPSVGEPQKAGARPPTSAFEQLAEALPHIVWSTDRSGLVDYFNRRWEEFTGRTPSEGLGERWLEVLHPDDRSRAIATWRSVSRGEGGYELEYRVRRHDGVYRWFLGRAYPIHDEAGVVVRWFGTSTDIDDVKRAVQEVHEREHWFRSIVETIPHMVWTTDGAGRPGYFSRQLQAFVGANVDLSRSSVWVSCFHPAEQARVSDDWARAQASGGSFGGEYRIRRHDGAFRWCAVACSTLRDDSGRIVAWIGTWTDIDERRRAEEALRLADQRKDQFLAILSHELRNPMAPILGGLQIIERAAPDSAPAQRAHETIRRQVGHLVRLVDDLLDVTRIQRGKIQLRHDRVDVVKLAERTVDDHRTVFERAGVGLSLRASVASAEVNGDATRLSQILSNLLQNAAKFTPRGGRTVVTVTPADDAVFLRVSDTGIGFDEETRAGLFEPFSQPARSIDRAQGGLGLGLALVRGLAELHCGFADAHSEGPGRGAEFVVKLPRVCDVTAPEAPPRDTAPHGRHRVVVIEDNPDAAQTLRDLLEIEGHEVAVAGNGAEGVEVVRRLHPDLVLCDLGLPEMDGYEVARRLRADPSLSDVRLVALSGYAAPEDVRRSLEAGFERHLSKPAPLEVLEQLLQ
jgi:PAS domain S-box-containing protein